MVEYWECSKVISGDLTIYKNVGSGVYATGLSTVSFTGNTVLEENWAGPGVYRILLRLKVLNITSKTLRLKTLHLKHMNCVKAVTSITVLNQEAYRLTGVKSSH